MFQQDQTIIKNQVLTWSRDLTRVKGTTSPLADAGGEFTEAPLLAQIDFAGKKRVVGTAIDIGCYEGMSSGLSLFIR